MLGGISGYLVTETTDENPERVAAVQRLTCAYLQSAHPFQWKNTLPWHLGAAAKVRILRFKNLPPFRHDPGLQKPRLRYSPGLAPTTRLNALLNAASDS
jgi:hypothetical protein